MEEDVITTTMFDLYDPGELIGPAFDYDANESFRTGDVVRVVSGPHAGQIGRIVREGCGPHRQGPLDYSWYAVDLSSGVRLYVAGWGWLQAVTS